MKRCAKNQIDTHLFALLGLFNGSPQAKCVQLLGDVYCMCFEFDGELTLLLLPRSHWQDENLSSPAAWLSKAPSLEELPDTMLWKKDEGKAESAKESASEAELRFVETLGRLRP